MQNYGGVGVSQCDTISIFEKMARRRGQRKGYLFQRSGWWLLTYRVDTPEGRERITAPVVRCAEAGKREAQRIAWEEILSKLDTMGLRPSSSRTFREFVEQRFRPDVIEHLKPGGKIHYELLMRKHILPSIGETPLRDITPARVQALLNQTLASKLSVQTAVHIKNAISAVLRHAKAMGWLFGELPTEMVRLPAMKRKERRALTWEQVCQISKVLPAPVDTLFVFLALTGLRVGEAMGLRRKRVNLSDSMVIVDGEVIPPHSIAIRESFSRGQWQSVKSSRARRNVPLPLWLCGSISALMEQSTFQAPDDPLFCSSVGTPMDAHNITNRVLRPALEKLGIKASFHVLRHTQATLADQAGATVTQRQRILGHAATDMTLHYTHADLDAMRPILESMVDPRKLN